jgi:hypothetical protein
MLAFQPVPRLDRRLGQSDWTLAFAGPRRPSAPAWAMWLDTAPCTARILGLPVVHVDPDARAVVQPMEPPGTCIIAQVALLF